MGVEGNGILAWCMSFLVVTICVVPIMLVGLIMTATDKTRSTDLIGNHWISVR